MTFRYAHSANYSFYHQMSSKLTKHNRIKKIGHQIHRKHYITPNNLSLDLADWWIRIITKKTHHPGMKQPFSPRVFHSLKGMVCLISVMNTVVSSNSDFCSSMLHRSGNSPIPDSMCLGRYEDMISVNKNPMHYWKSSNIVFTECKSKQSSGKLNAVHVVIEIHKECRAYLMLMFGH